MMQPKRIVQVMDQLASHASKVGLRPDYVQSVFKLIIEETCNQEERLIQQRLGQGQRS